MKSFFRKFRKDTPTDEEKQPNSIEPSVSNTAAQPAPPQPDAEKRSQKDDSFILWCRTNTRGGIERIERNNIYEAYGEYGADTDGRLIYRYYHRYPEHERGYDLSDERVLSFDAFNTRLLSELDRGDIRLGDYHACISKAQQNDSHADTGNNNGFNETETAILRRFCEDIDTLKDKTYRSSEGIFRCEGVSVIGDETLDILFRKPLKNDALYREVSGVDRSAADAYGIDDLWIMGVVNRLRERCASCRVETLKSAWSLKGETVCLIICEGFDGIQGDLIVAAAQISDLIRFGFYSLDFSNK